MSIPKHINIEDAEQLLAYLHETNRILQNDIPHFVVLPGGVSNRTVLVQREIQPDWIIKQALERLRVQVDWFSAPERIHREAAGLRCLSQVIRDHVPTFLFEDMDLHILAMSAIQEPHHNWKTQLLSGEPDIDHAIQFGELLAHIHNAIEDHPEIAHEFSNSTFFEELRIEPYYVYTASQVPHAESFLNRLIQDTRRRKLTLVHGDYSPKNVLLYANRLYILDYEVIHFGDPAFDVGFSMTHFLCKAHYRKTHRPIFITMASAYWRAYSAMISDHLLSQSLEIYAVRHTLACLMARVAGRSPLEYLETDHRKRQRDIVLKLITIDINTISDLIQNFEETLEVMDDED